MGDGTIKYPGWNTGGVVKSKGMRNKRKRKMRLKKEQEVAERRAKQRAREEREANFAAEWGGFKEERDR